mmetsp:Transcript_4950/g.16151  ORF Transcript_4950/g.16151 Transcript_4950/m.16151 type:complete len:345 (+) Transcript_4950:102-1136(+)
MCKAQECKIEGSAVAKYLSMDGVLEGIGALLQQSMGVAMSPVELAPGEGWAPGIRKMALSHGDRGPLGHIYLDLLPRPHKFSHNAHFTIRCGRSRPGGGYRAPLVALVCNFSGGGGPGSLLSHSELETLIHELGHALHSLLSRTRYQHMSGTRGALDFVETPSHLMEHFVWDERSLKVLARHHVTKDPMPSGMVARLRKSKSLYSALDLQSQVVMSLLDQDYFGTSPPGRGETTAMLEALQRQHSVVGPTPGTCQQVRFGHLVGYGAGYYSYLYARCFSGALWRELFSEDPLSPAAGERYWQGLLRHGSSRDPAALMKGLVGEGAMLEVEGGFIPNVKSGDFDL